MDINWKEFDKDVDIERLEKDVQEASERDFGDFPDVPYGKYEVKIHKLELVKSNKGDPMVSVWFKIINGNYKESMIFMNQVVVQGFQIHTANEFLRSLKTDESMEFKGYEKYNILLLNIYEKVLDNEYELEYTENKKGYKKFEILQKFDTEPANKNEAEEIKDEIGW